jgi:hypothetical protein
MASSIGLYYDTLHRINCRKEIGEVVINKLETKVPEELLALLNPADREFLKDATYSEALTYMVFEGENSKSNAMTQLYISKGKLYFGGEVMNLSDFADASKLNLIQEFLATYKTRNINLKRLADPKETAYKTHVIDNGLLTTNAGFETEYDANNKPISKKGEASNPKTLFKSLDLQVYSTKEEKMSNRFRQATVYVNPSLNNPSELVKPTEEIQETKPLESSEKSSILSPLNTTQTIIEQQEKLKENMTDISSPVTREPNKINLEANQEAITKQKESLTKNTMSAAEKLAARKKEIDCNQKNKK